MQKKSQVFEIFSVLVPLGVEIKALA